MTEGKRNNDIMNILVIDAQGGGIGKQIVSALKKRYPEQYITAVGTNSLATSAMKSPCCPVHSNQARNLS